MKFILGHKEQMIQLFNESGEVVPGTVVSVAPTYVLQTKQAGQKGAKYNSLTVGYGTRRASNLNKPQRELVKQALVQERGFAGIKEFNSKRGPLPESAVGDLVDASVFAEGDKVRVSAISKGKGFQGVVKRHGFAGGPRSHGQKHSEREPGSIGVGGRQRVMPGMRMAGRMGGERITIKNLMVARVDATNNLIFIKGAVPGRKGTLVEIVAE